jgi:hypothetical protein
MTIEKLQKLRFFRDAPTAWDKKQYPKGQAFKRLGLTLSAKGWTASVEFDGTTGTRGTGATQEEAIGNAIASLSKWNCYAK